MYLPVAGDKGELRGLIGLLSERFYDYAGAARTERDPDPAQAGRVEELRSALIEGIIQESEDEGLMDRYLSGEDIATKVLIADLEKAVARGSFYPVLAVASLQGVGLAELLEVMTQAFPDVYKRQERDRARRGEQPQSHREYVRHAEAGQAGGDQDDDDPLRPLGHANVGPYPQSLSLIHI